MLKVVLLLTLWALVQPKSVPRHKRMTVCYDALGCFSTKYPFFSLQRPLSFVPESPSFINPDFTLFTQQNVNNGDVLHTTDVTALKSSHFNAHRPTKVIVHGYLENGKASWLTHMKNEFLKTNDFNVIIVGWGKGSLPPYTQATANTRVVGAMIAQLIKTIQKTTGAQPETFHIIGHSLGAHIAGYAGERIQHVGRISGLDPAEPYYQNTDIRVRLDPSDALFVDVIHTDGQSILKLGYGMKQTCGHVDYFPNGGMTQPGCDKGPITSIKLEGLYDGVKNFVACSHLRSHYLFIESINSRCSFDAYQCNSYDDFEFGKCMPCNGKACGHMGFHADKVKPARGLKHVKYFLKTSGDGPFCRYHYKVQLSFGSQFGARAERGDMFVNLIGKTGQTGELTLNKDHMYVQPGMSYNFVVTSVKDIGDITNVEFRWHHNSALLNPLSWNLLNFRHPRLYLNKVNVVNGHTSNQYTLCGHSGGVENGHKDRLSIGAHTC
ncbi:pancreatic triacylglycerol lipase-like [Gigantopelta aegis]|uniref:pancreatic triacylglycerol lipase-like n=1 Tax=Gigantopelta aegis TaxID=1735272 RepID=UPI001B88CB6B|nr:pancreatic triacylglycerol lipase-like [Gigantopelta aegis]